MKEVTKVFSENLAGLNFFFFNLVDHYLDIVRSLESVSTLALDPSVSSPYTSILIAKIVVVFVNSPPFLHFHFHSLSVSFALPSDVNYQSE